MFFLIYLPPMPAGAPSPSLLLLTGARRGWTSTSFFVVVVQLSAKIKQAGLYLESRGSQPPDHYVQSRSQPCIPSCNKSLKFDPQICREGAAFVVGLSLLTLILNAIGGSWGILH